jgi:hypothetical protein
VQSVQCSAVSAVAAVMAGRRNMRDQHLLAAYAHSISQPRARLSDVVLMRSVKAVKTLEISLPGVLAESRVWRAFGCMLTLTGMSLASKVSIPRPRFSAKSR